LVVNTAHPLVKKILTDEETACQAEVSPLVAESTELESRIKSLKDAHKDKKDEEVPQAEKEEISSLESKTGELKTKKETIISGFAAQNKEVRQLIDLALLSNNMLKGEALSNFVKRSIELMK